MSNCELDTVHTVTVLAPVADAFAGTVSTDIVDASAGQGVVWTFTIGVGATGTSTITVEECTDNTGTGATAVAFQYRQATTRDTWSAWTAAAAAGFATTAGSDKDIQVRIYTADLSNDSPWVRLTAVEVVDSPVLGGVVAQVFGLRYARSVNATVLS